MISEHKFGSFIINDRSYLGDIKIINSKVRYWNDREFHELNLKDIKELLEANPEIIIVGTGNSGLLEISNEARSSILSKRINLVVEKNTDAIKKYNKAISENKKVAAIFHATC